MEFEGSTENVVFLHVLEIGGIGQPDNHFVVALIGVLEGLGSNMSVKR
jgi:hypothetical protein